MKVTKITSLHPVHAIDFLVMTIIILKLFFVTLFILCFQCSGSSESEVVLQHLSESSRHLVVLGGGCVSEERRPLEIAPRDTGRVYRTHVPQVNTAVTSICSSLEGHAENNEAKV